MLADGTWNDLPNSSLRQGIVEFNVLTTATYPGYTNLGQFNGHTYYFATTFTPWLTPRANAQAIGGDLASMNSQEENDFINDQNIRGWVGGFHDRNDPAYVEPGNAAQNFGGWRWTDGTRLGAGQIFIVQTAGPASGTAFDLGVTEVTFTGTDEAGNSATCSFNVTVEDDTPPARPTLDDVTGECSATATAPITTDNCSGTITGTTSDPLTYDAQGTYTITWTFEDGNENTSTANQTVIVKDVTAPVVSCPVDISVAADADLCTAAVTYAASVIDRCTSVPALTYSIVSGTAFDKGTTPVTVTADDLNGNTATYTFNVVVQDEEAPVATCTDINVILVDRNVYSLTQTDIDAIAAGTADNCAGVTYAITAGTTVYDCDDRDAQFSVTLTATDAAGLTNSSDANVTITDPNSVCNDPPVAVCNTVTVDADANCTSAAAGADFGINSSDPDGDDLTFNVSPAGPFALGTTNVTLSVSDGEFTTTCTTSITVVDNTAPTAICQDVTVQLDTDGNAAITTPDIDNGSTDNCSVASLALDVTAFDCADLGPNPVTLTLTDNNGNVSTCTATVTVTDAVAPTAVCADQTVVLDATPSATLTAADVDGGSDDNCGFTLALSRATITFADYPSTTVELTVSDAAGNTATCTATVEVTVPCNNVTDGGEISADEFGCGTFIAAPIVSLAPASGGGIAPIEYLWLSTTNPELPVNQWTPVGSAETYQPGTLTETAYFIRCARRLGCDDYAAESNVIVKAVNGEGQVCDANQTATRISGNGSWVKFNRGVRWSQRLLGAPDGQGAQFYDYNDRIRVSLPDHLPAGSEVTITWKRRDYGGSRPARLLVYERSNNGRSYLNEILFTNVTDFYVSTTITLDRNDVDELYLRNRRHFADFEIDAISYCATVCENTDYCAPNNLSTQYEYIQRVGLHHFDNWTGDDGGYGDYTHLSVDLERGATECIYLRPGFFGHSYVEYWQVYIDFDQNGEFDWYERVHRSRGRNQQFGWVHVPTWASLGETRMRVVMSYGGYAEPCDDDFYGEMEDYTVNITGSRGYAKAATPPAPQAQPVVKPLTDVIADRSDARTIEEDATEEAAAVRLSVFPNPTNGPATVKWEGFAGENVQLSVVNQMGQVLVVEQLATTAGSYELGSGLVDLPAGTYLIMLRNDSARAVERLIIVR